MSSKNGEKLDKVLEVYVSAERPIKKLVEYSMGKASEIMEETRDGVGLLYLPSYSHMASSVGMALYGQGKSNVQIALLDTDLKKLGIKKKYMGNRDLFAFGYLDKNKKPILKKIIERGMKLVKDGSVKSFHYFNVDPKNPKFKNRFKETSYTINLERLERAGKLTEEPHDDTPSLF